MDKAVIYCAWLCISPSHNSDLIPVEQFALINSRRVIAESGVNSRMRRFSSARKADISQFATSLTLAVCRLTRRLRVRSLVKL